MSGLGFTHWGALAAIAFGVSFCTIDYANAQITPDGTLPNNTSVIREGNTFNITGGTQAGGNLFHSFGEFSVNNGGTASFNNALDIQNIISRVTGGSVSNIDGIIRTLGKANLFLINPNGIIFGSNARLEIGGSFLASTASSLKFKDNLEFSAIDPQPAPLLSINVPIGLQFGSNPGAILAQGDGQGIRTTLELIDTKNALRVEPNQTLALIGSDISLEGATLKTAGGRIELGSVAGEGLVGLTPTNKGFSLSYNSGNQKFRNIKLSQRAVVDASGEGGGDIQIQGRRISLFSGSQIEASTLGTQAGGTLLVNASESVELSGTSSLNEDSRTAFASQVYVGASGAGGNSVIRTAELIVRDGAIISTDTYGAGKGGDLTVDAQNVQLIGTSANGQLPTGLFASADLDSTGDAGDLTIKTNTLLVKDGAVIGTSTFGAGKGGNLTVHAQDVQLIGTSADGQLPTGLFASAQRNSTGDAGDLTIKTNTLLVKDGAQVSASTFGAGKGGNLTVDAQDVQIIGTNADIQFPSGLFTSAQRNSTGDAGDLTIKTNTLLVQDGAAIAVQSLGTGTAGNLTIDAPSIRLDNNALLSGNAQSAKVYPNREQATININSKILTLSRNSNIRTNARGENVIGGNINIDTDFLIAFKNSDISANSTNFRGGNVRINAQGIFGTQFRDVASDSTSDITATGASPEFSGSVELNTPGIDPNSGLVDLPTVAVDTQIAQGCYSPGYAQNSFIITGRGGLPPNPREAFTSNIVRPEWATLSPSNDINSQQTIKEKPFIPTPPAPIVEATGWGTNTKGEIVLTANASTGTPHKNWQQSPVTCSSAKSADN
jgi:filamentous hemagglutinin family protein